MPCQGVRLRTSAVFLKKYRRFDRSVLVVDLQKQQPVHEIVNLSKRTPHFSVWIYKICKCQVSGIEITGETLSSLHPACNRSQSCVYF